MSSFSSKDGQVFENNYVKMMGSRLVISFENENYNTHRWSLDIENARQLHKKILFVYNTKEGKMKDRRKFMENEKRIYLDDGPNFDFYKIENILKFEYNLIEKNARANLFKIIQSKNNLLLGKFETIEEIYLFKNDQTIALMVKENANEEIFLSKFDLNDK